MFIIIITVTITIVIIITSVNILVYFPSPGRTALHSWIIMYTYLASNFFLTLLVFQNQDFSLYVIIVYLFPPLRVF